MVCSLFLCLPLAVFPGELYPEVPAALLIAVAIRAIDNPEAASSWLIAGVVVLLPWFQVRLLPAAVILALAAMIMRKLLRLLPILALVTSLLVQAMVFQHWYGTPWPWAPYGTTATIPFGNILVGALGLLVDQQSGLFIAAPVFLFLPLAAVAAWQFDRRRTLLGAALVGSYFAAVSTSNLWHGNWSPPARLLVAILPVLVFWMAALAHTVSRTGRVFTLLRVAALISMVPATFYVLFPDKRCGPVGRQGFNYLLYLGERITGLGLTKAVPALQNPTPRDVIMAALLVGFWIIGTGLLAKHLRSTGKEK